MIYYKSMVKQQPINDWKQAFNYISALGKWSDKDDEVVEWFANPDYPKDAPNFAYLNKQLNHKEGKRTARVLEIAIPHKLKNDVDKQKEFITDFMDKLDSAYQIPKNKHLWICSIHNKRNKKGELNLHAHVLMSERLTLDKPIKKVCRARHYKNYDIPKHTEIKYFDKKLQDKNGKALFETKEFAKNCNVLWRSMVKEKGLEKQKDYINLIPYKNRYSSKCNLAKKRYNAKYNAQVKSINKRINKNNLSKCIKSLLYLNDNQPIPSVPEFHKKWDEMTQMEKEDLMRKLGIELDNELNETKEQENENENELELNNSYMEPDL